MLNSQVLVWGLFRFIDLAIIALLVVYGFVRWGLPFIRAQLAAHKKTRESIHQEISGLKYDAEKLAKALAYDQARIERLEQQIAVWKESVKRQQNKKMIEQKDRCVAMQKLKKVQQERMYHQMLLEKAVPEAFTQATKELEDCYKDDGGKQCIATIIDWMHKETS